MKRWIEREVGGLLAERIATSGRAEQRLVQVFAREGSGTLDARVTAIVEAEPRAPEPICSLGESAELAHLVAELARVAEPLAARPSDDALDVLESALSRALAEQRQKRDRSASLLSLGTAIESLRTLRDRIEQWTGTREERERERIADENELEPYELLSEGRVRRVRRVAAGAPTDRARRLTQAELREALLDALRVRRTLGLADDPDAHAVHVVLSRTGGGREPSWLLTELARAYASLASDVPFVVQRRGERPELVELERGEQLGGLVMLRLVGPAIARMMEPEQGTHLWERLEGAPQLVTVRVASAAETRPASEAFADMERELEAGRARFRDALERGASELPDDPDAPPALVRRYRISASDAEGFAYQIEDLATLQVAEGRARTLGQALAAVLDARAADARTLGEERT